MKILIATVNAVFVAVLLAGCGKPDGRAVTGPLMVYCAANLKKPVELAAAEFQREFGVQVQLQFGGSGTLVSQLRAAQRGDLYLAADDGSMADARRHGVIREVIPVARQHPVIAVRVGNPKKIHSLADLLRADVKVALANPEAASIGRVAKTTLTNLWPQLAAHAVVMKPTVSEIASDLALGAVDAAIVYDSTVPQFRVLEAVEVPEFSKREEVAGIAVLSFCAQPAAALKFARYLAAPEKGGAAFKGSGFTPVNGDAWAAKPELILYSGGVNRPAVEQLLKQFANREGVTVTTVFNGCGILCATMKTMESAAGKGLPDAYYACDLCFVPPVAHLFPSVVLLTETDIGLVVRRGNPRGVRTLADLAQPGLKVGLCNAEQSTLGYMTRGMLQSVGLRAAIQKNVVVEVPTADLLIVQMRAGALDAAIVYRVNASPVAEHLDYLPIDHPGAKAVQPFGVRKNSSRSQLAGRLLEFFLASRAEFERAGFLWRGEAGPIPSKDIKIPEWLMDK